MKRLLLMALFTLCLSGIAYAQDPAGPSSGPPTIGGGSSEIKGGISINGDGEVRTSGGQVLREGTRQEKNGGEGPKPEKGTEPGEPKTRDPWEGLRGEPKDRGPSNREPKDKELRDTERRDPLERRGGRRDL
jgi:hypothetical protein